MTTTDTQLKHVAMTALGARGGKSRSPAKLRAARENVAKAQAARRARYLERIGNADGINNKPDNPAETGD